LQQENDCKNDLMAFRTTEFCSTSVYFSDPDRSEPY